MSKTNIKASIDANIKRNGKQEITGQVLNATLNAMVTDYAEQAALDGLKEKVDALALGAFYGYFPESNSLPTDMATPGYAYVGTDNPYEIWNFNGESWSDSGTSIDMNDADEEDITRNTDGKLQFKDRAYGDGMGYIILRKNKTFAEQVTGTNTIYEIRDNFNLSNASVTIPSGCILYFRGGKVTNGTLVGQDTGIVYDSPIFTGIQISGSWNVPEIHSWMMTDIASDKLYDLCCLQNENRHNLVVIEKGNYSVAIRAKEAGGFAMFAQANTTMIIDGTITLDEETTQECLNYGYYILRVLGNNVHIKGGGTLIGDFDDVLEYGAIGKTEFGHGVYMLGVTDVSVEGITITKCYGDCIGVSVKCGTIDINNVKVDGWHRNGIGVVGVSNRATIKNIIASNSGTYSPAAVIDVEPNAGNSVNFVEVDGIKASNIIDLISGYAPSGSSVGNVIVKNVDVENLSGKFVTISYSYSSIKSNLYLENINISSVTTPHETNIIGFAMKYLSEGKLVMDNVVFDGASLDISPAYPALHIDCKNPIIRNCSLASPSVFSYHLKNAVIENCILKTTASNNLILSSSSTPASKLIFSGCSIYGGIAGYFVETKFKDCNFVRTTTANFAFLIQTTSSPQIIGVEFLGCVFSADFEDETTSMAAISINCYKSIFRNIIIDNTNGKFTRGIVVSGDNNIYEDINFVNFADSAIKFTITSGKVHLAPSLPNVGTTASRPSIQPNYYNNMTKGFLYFDTDLGKMIVWNGSAWINVDGTAL